MNNRPTSPFLRALDALLEGRTGSWVINLFVIPAMILLVLILPPLSLPQRVLSAGYTGVAPKGGGNVSLEDGTYFSIPAGALKSDAGIRLDSIQPGVFAKNSAAQSLPPTLEIKSPAYEPSLQGSPPSLAILSIPIPDDASPITTLDVYGYDGKNWSKFAFQAYPDDLRVEAHITSVMPRYVVLVQTQAQAPTLSADLTAKSQVPTPATALIAEVNPVGLTIADSGGISGSVPQLPEASASSPYQVLPTIDDLDGSQSLGALVDDMVSSPDTRKQHVQALVDLAVEKLYPGLNIDYQDVNEDNQADFTAFVRELATALHAKDKILSVTVPLPTQASVDVWNTGAYDWGAIGSVADIVKIPLPATREAYVGDNPPVQTYLQWAVGQIDRYKLQITFSAMGRDEFNRSFAPIGFSNAAKLMGPVDAPTVIVPDAKVPLDLPKLRDAGGIKLDVASGLYSFGYKDDKGQAHIVWLETAGSLLKKLGLAQEFNVRGVALRDLNGDAVESRMWNVLTQYHNSATPAIKGKFEHRLARERTDGGQDPGHRPTLYLDGSYTERRGQDRGHPFVRRWADGRRKRRQFDCPGPTPGAAADGGSTPRGSRRAANAETACRAGAKRLCRTEPVQLWRAIELDQQGYERGNGPAFPDGIQMGKGSDPLVRS